MRVINYSFVLFLFLVSSITPVLAKQMYVTDRILLGVHTEPDEQSPLLASINSGSAVEVLEENEGFNQVKLADGKIGWVSAGYLVNDAPATAQLDKLVQQLKLIKDKSSQIEEKYRKRDRELQVRNDQLSNARTSIRELKKKLKFTAKGSAPIQVDTAMAEELAAANLEIEKLKVSISEQTIPEVMGNGIPDKNIELQLIQARLNVEKMQNRIDFALANLSGEFNPDEDELQRLKPKMPAWIWALVMLALIGGLIIGIIGMDIRVRKRHGGFRL